MKKVILSLFVTLINTCFSQDLHLRGVGTTYSQTGKVSKKWNYNLNVTSVYNAYNQTIGEKTFPSGHVHFVPHLGFIRKMNDNVNAGFGYGFGRHDIFGLRENEHRLFVQSTYSKKYPRFSVSQRGRFEYRSPLNLKTNIRSDAAIGRYQLSAVFPFYDTKTSKKGFYASASNEIFFYVKGATNGPVSSKNGSLLSENWSNIGLGYTNKKNRFELGYGFQALVRNKAQDMRFINLCTLSYSTTINWDDVQFWFY